jgi:carbamoylphosphate synthase large subunit
MSYRVKLRSKNPSARELKTMLATMRTNRPIVVRLGSRTPMSVILPRADQSNVIEINSIAGITNSRDKRLMKECFRRAEVKSANWWHMSDPDILISVASYPAIIKQRGSHGGEGIFLINTQEELAEWVRTHGNLSSYIIEEYKNFTKEYRLHVTKDGCFYTCRKMLKADATERWHRHDSNCVWIIEENPLFEKPSNWDSIVAECVKALNAVGLDTGACDVKVQSDKGKKSSFIPDFIVMEINSAPSLASITTEKYLEKLSSMIQQLDI